MRDTSTGRTSLRRQRAILAAAGAIVSAVPLTAQPARTHASTIGIAVGPCFGFCPVYSITLSPDGRVLYTGERHAAVIGERRRNAGRRNYAAIARALAPFRPASGSTSQVPCGEAVTDTSTYTVSWTDADGQVTTATLRSLCRSGPAAAMERVVRRSLERLQVGRWSRQTTRPGALR